MGQGQYSANATFASAQTVKTTSAFAGLFKHSDIGWSHLKQTLLGGLGQNTSIRTVNNNLVGGGTQSAVGTYTGWFVAPRVELSRQYQAGKNTSLFLAGHLGGVFAGQSGYGESDSSANLTLSAQRQVMANGQISVGAARQFGHTSIDGSIGLNARHTFGGQTVTGSLLGGGISYQTGSQGDRNSGFAKIGMKHQFSDSGFVGVSLSTEATSSGGRSGGAEGFTKINY